MEITEELRVEIKHLDDILQRIVNLLRFNRILSNILNDGEYTGQFVVPLTDTAHQTNRRK